MKEIEISNKLKLIGFIHTHKKGFGNHSRITHPAIDKGSLYIGDSYVGATGKYIELKNIVPETSTDHQGYPEWTNENIKYLIQLIELWIKI